MRLLSVISVPVAIVSLFVSTGDCLRLPSFIRFNSSTLTPWNMFDGSIKRGRYHNPFRCMDATFVTNSTVTFYGSPDNDPAWSNATAYDCGLGRNFTAGGDGSLENPLSFAAAHGEYRKCEVVYFPYIMKYLIHDDFCATCTSPHVDVWISGAPRSDKLGPKQIKCEEALTPPQGQLVVRHPPHDLHYTRKPLWTGKKCHKKVRPGATPRTIGCRLH